MVTKFKEQAKEHELKVPPEFWLLDESELATYGCGPGKGIGDKLVPDTMWGLNVKVCCIVHDLDWAKATCISDLERANERFLVNLIKLINNESVWFLKGPRRIRALTYYSAVQDIGTKIAKKKFK